MKKIMVLILMMFLIAGCTSYVNVSPVPEYNKVTVNGQAEFKSMPDLARFNVRVESAGDTAVEATAFNAKLVDEIKSALVAAGIKSSDIETASFNVYPWKRWEPKTGKEILEGYKAYHTLEVETKDIEDIGRYIDAAVNSGATDINGVTFTFSKTRQKEMNDEALKLAVANAKEKAKTLAETSGTRLGMVLSISASSFATMPYYAPRAMGAVEEEMFVQTDISPREVTTSAAIEMSFLLE